MLTDFEAGIVDCEPIGTSSTIVCNFDEVDDEIVVDDEVVVDEVDEVVGSSDFVVFGVVITRLRTPLIGFEGIAVIDFSRKSTSGFS